MKKRWSIIYSYVLLTLLLSACTSVDADAAQKYKQQNVLQVDITVPDSIQTGVPQPYVAKFVQKDIIIDDPDVIQFHIWSSDDRNNPFHETIEPIYIEGGMFKADIVIPQDGIYYFQVIASSQGSEIMPTMQLIVGDVELPQPDQSSTTSGNNNSGKHH
ncbi:hypothetical protein [Paenibacillus sp. An7]|uniref:hypothetical protein n=1 Tax=Paenibacillus sp. An7 TaxID=2689577 RepID=UPI00135BAA1C|nr:hypothetical protein [Paenibacillus sp. An7]